MSNSPESPYLNSSGQAPTSGQAPAPAVPPPTAPARNKRRQKVILIVFLVVVAGIFGAVFLATRNNATNAQVGDCVAQNGANSIAVVKCDDPTAAFKVVGRVENKTEVEASLNACDPYKDTEQAYWEGKQGEAGLVLCLAKAK